MAMKLRFMSPLLLVLTGCAITSVQPLSVPLAYAPPDDPAPLRTPNCGAIARVDVQDVRTDTQLGLRTLEGKPMTAPVTSSNDPAGWVHDGLLANLQRDGFVVAGKGPTLRIELRGLKTSENVWHRAGYDARIDLGATLRTPAGRVCWSASLVGKGGNYGYAGSIENYRETLNEALNHAAQSLVDAPTFETTLCQCAD
jgi:hypothetical protein